MPDCWTLNPYRGCSLGCRYCYARYTHEFLGLEDPESFEQRIFVKVGAASALEREATERKLRARPVAIGTVTDPYQPAEARYGLTRSILEVLSRHRGLRVSITTKSALVSRDLDLLSTIAERSALTLHVSLVTTDRELARDLDPGAPTPARRLRTIRTLAGAGLDVGVNVMPVLPGITDGDRELTRLFRAARVSGARWAITAPLFLASMSRRHFFSWLRSRRPDLLPLYRRLYSDGVDIDRGWRDSLRSRVARIRHRTGLPAPPHPRESQAPPWVQLGLPGLGVPGRAAPPGPIRNAG
jgi:DNA repair photolyase